MNISKLSEDWGIVLKHKKGFSLKNKIFSSFIAVCFSVVVIIKNLDYIYWEILDQKLNPSVTDYNQNTPSRIMYLILNLLIFIAAAYVFYKLTARAIRQETKRKLEEQNLIYATLAHDLKTPMTSVQGFAKALSDGKVKPEEQQEIFDIIYRKSNSMNDMINTLFEYARLGTDGCQPQMSPNNICTLVRDVIAENYNDFEDHHIELALDIPESEMIINGDKKELRRAFTNLIVNIYKHNPDGIKAEIAVFQNENNAVIRIADSGTALPENMDIFEPFVTENTARTNGHGTGLGLAITKRIIEQHGGTICAEKENNEYTKAFIIRIRLMNYV